MYNKIIQSGLIIAGSFIFIGTAFADNLVVNGDFSAGNTGFTSGYTLVTDNNCYPETTYDMVVNPNNCHNLWSSFGDDTTGTGNMMAVNGATSPNVTVWSETVNVSANTNYDLSAWIASSYPLSPAVLDFSINGAQVGTDFTASTTTGLWQQFNADWNSGASSSAVLTIVDLNTQADGNDFALDDIRFGTETATPEPGYFAFVGVGLAGLLIARRRFARISSNAGRNQVA